MLGNLVVRERVEAAEEGIEGLILELDLLLNLLRK